LLLDEAGARFYVGVHDEVTELVRSIEATASLVVLIGVEQHGRAVAGVGGEGVDAAVHHRFSGHGQNDDAGRFKGADEVTDRAAADPEGMSGFRGDEADLFASRVGVDGDGGDGVGGEVDVVLESVNDAGGELHEGEGLVSGQRGGRAEGSEVHRGGGYVGQFRAVREEGAGHVQARAIAATSGTVGRAQLRSTWVTAAALMPSARASSVRGVRARRRAKERR
jgi:hypothetical protein